MAQRPYSNGDNTFEIPDEVEEGQREALDQAQPIVTTSQSIRCGGIWHPAQIVLFSWAAHVPWNDFLAEAQRQGWQYDAAHKVWLCPGCASMRER